MAVIDLKHTTVSIQDGTPTTPKSIEIKVGSGNMSYTEKRNIEYILDRGRLDTTREGDEVPVEAKFDFQWEYITSDTGATTPTVEEALKKTGAASTWVSSETTDSCAPYAVDIVFEYAPDCTGEDVTNSIETITLKYFRWESLEHDMKSAQVSASGNCNVTVADAVRTAPSP